jgi:CRISPR-associated endonuclease Csn1
MNYRLALDLGSKSLGWAMFRLNASKEPIAVIKAGIRIFSDGREPAAPGQVGTSLAANRREKRAMRRRHDRLLKRKTRMMDTLVKHGFFPADEAARKALEQLDPYTLRAKGLEQALTPAEFARALFHINQRRGFKSNRKLDKIDTTDTTDTIDTTNKKSKKAKRIRKTTESREADVGAMQTAIKKIRDCLASYPVGPNGKPLKTSEFDLLKWVNRQLPETQNDLPRTVGEWLAPRSVQREGTRARNNGQKGGKLVYDLYIDRAMIEAEFDALWAKQADLNPTQFKETARKELKNCLLYQRPLKSVKPGRCTFNPDQERAPLALPSQQRFRIYQEVNNLRILGENLKKQRLTPEQCKQLVDKLEYKNELKFTEIRTLLRLPRTAQFNLEDVKRKTIKGNIVSATLSEKNLFGQAWAQFDHAKQDAIVMQLFTEENEACLVQWLQDKTGVDEARAKALANVSLPEGYGSLSDKTLARILPKLQEPDEYGQLRTFNEAVQAAGFAHHSDLGFQFDYDDDEVELVDGIESTGEIKAVYAFKQLPYYGRALKRHVAFPNDTSIDKEERLYGKIANPTVHIGLNQVRKVVNALIKRYGRPTEVIVEVASELKRRPDHRKKEFRIGKITEKTMRRYCSCAGCVNVRQDINQKRNQELRAQAFDVLGHNPSDKDMEKMRLWQEMKELNNCIVICPYSGEPLSVRRILLDDVEIDHILPRSITLDDGMANKVLCIREANRKKGGRPPIDAKDDFAKLGWKYEDIIERVKNWPEQKRYRFNADAMETWKGRADTFLARALNDTRYLCRMAYEYLSLVCPVDTRVIPGQMTAKLRHEFGLDSILGLKGEKNRNDHRHHAVDACVIGITDQGMLQKFADAYACEERLNVRGKEISPPWSTYCKHVQRAIDAIWVSHKPDHGYEGKMLKDTAYCPPRLDLDKKWRTRGINGEKPDSRDASTKAIVPVTEPKQPQRHGIDADGQPLSYKGYESHGNYCIEIVRDNRGRWKGEVITTFSAYQRVAAEIKMLRGKGLSYEDARHQAEKQLRSKISASGKPLVMRLYKKDSLRAEIDGQTKLLRVVKIASSTNVVFAEIREAGDLKARHDDSRDSFRYVNLQGDAFRKAKARRVTISPIGELRDPGFRE